MPEESSNKENKARRQLGQHKWQPRRVSRSSPAATQPKEVFDWNEADLLDFAGSSDLTDDTTIQNPINHAASILDAPYLTTPQSIDHQSYPMHEEASYIGSLVCTLAEDSTNDGNNHMPAAPESSMNSNGLNGFSALHLAAHFGKFSVIQLLLASCPEAVDQLNNDAETPLHIAVSEGHTDVVVELLRSGANTLLQDADRRTPLHLAVLKEHVDIVRLLLDDTHGPAMIHLTDHTGKTPLHQAVLQGCGQIIQLLLAKGADPRMPVSKTSGGTI